MEQMTTTSETVQLVIPFQALTDAVSKLSLKDKNRLWEMLYEQIEQEEEDLMEQDPEVKARIEQALRDYAAGDYITIQEYMAQQQQKED